MIRLIDTVILATTKLRTRRVRTIITVGISGLLFAALVGLLAMSQGALESINTFNKDGLSSHYIVSASPDSINTVGVYQDPNIIARATDLYNQTVAAKKVAAKKLNLTYDPTTEPKPIIPLPGGPSTPFLNLAAPSAQQAMQEYDNAHPQPGLQDLQATSASYHPISTYASSEVQPADGGLAVMKDGQETFPSSTNTGQSQPDILTANQFAFMPKELTTPFLLKKTTWTAQSNSIPLLVPYSIATKLLNLTALPNGASPDVKLKRIQDLYNTAGSVTIDACYRNNASSTQIQTAVTTASQIAQNASNKNHTKPSLIYGLPAANSCGAAVVTSDTRTKQEKLTDANQATFDAEFSTSSTVPVQQKLTFQIVGLEPDQQNAPSNSAAGILQSLVGSSLSNIIAIPSDLYGQLPSVQRYNDLLAGHANTFGFNTPPTYYAEFATADQARQFINQKSCTARSDGTCASPGKPFQLSAFGSNSIALKDLQHKFTSFFGIAALIVVGIAIIIMTGTVGRMLADSRRETAVFRAIGANRFDISAIYTIYTLLLACMTAITAVGLGLILAHIGDMHFWKATTVQAKLAFGGADTNQNFHFFGYTMRIWWIALVAIGAGLLGMVLPLLRNVRRNPIKDMREE